MPAVHPFRAVRYPDTTELAAVSAPPYDVIAPDERSELDASHPHNIVKLTLGSQHPDDHDHDNRYTRAAQRWRDWLAAGILIRDPGAGIFLYRCDFAVSGGERSSAGIVAALELEELGAAGIFGHEKTRPGPKADRLALMRATRANLEPLWFFASAPMTGFRALVEDLAATEPLGDVTDPQQVRHRSWALPPDQASQVRRVLAGNPLVVADGHHRYETALTYRDERRLQDGPGPWDRTLALISDPLQFAPELLAIHRLVTDLDPDGIPGLQPFAGDFDALYSAVQERGHGTIGVAKGSSTWTVETSGDVDTVWLADTVFEPNGCDVVYEHNLRIVRQALGEGSTAFLMAPVPVSLVAGKALAGVRMPPKTTLFWPKPRTGLLMRDLDQDG